MPKETPAVKSDRSDRREGIAILAATLIGAVLRCWHLDRIGLTHFDEGIYAIAGLWSVTPGGLSAYQPASIAYAPPGFPILIGLSYLFLGVSDVSAILVSIVVGTLSIPLLGWLGRRSFGPGAGAIAAGLGAISGAHVSFSRMALTDATFLASWLIALSIGGIFLERPGVVRAILLGLAVGLSQHFKYNGWLSGVIVAMAAIPGLGFRKESAKLLGLLAMAGGIAAMGYVPWYRFVEAQPGGYSALLKHHSSYLRGIELWPTDWRIQMDQSVALSGGPIWGVLAWAVGWTGGVFSAARSGSSRRSKIAAIVLLALGGLCLAMLPNLPWWLSLASMPWLLRDPRPSVRMVAVSWFLLAILTPFYHPYARLWLPSIAASWLIVGGMAVEGFAALASGSKMTARCAAGSIGLVAAVSFSFLSSRRPEPHDALLGPTDSVREAVASLHRSLGDSPATTNLLGRPPVLYYGMLQGRSFARLENARDLDRELSGPVIVEEAQLRQEGDPATILERLSRRWLVVEAFPDLGSVPTILDENPEGAYDRSSGSNGRMWLLRRREGTASR